MEKKSRNRSSENLEKELKCAGDTDENMSEAATKQYKRDFMLQLRLNHLSLQKPNNLPNVEVVKEKLNLHNISDPSCETEDKIHDMYNSFPSSKSEYFSAKHDYPLMSSYYNRMSPYCYAHHLYNGSYSTAAMSKYRMATHGYYNPFKKTFVGNYPCLNTNLGVDDCFVPKRYYPSSEDIWPSFSSSEPTNFNKNNNGIDVPKARKKLSIIDPVTGKNILESPTATESNADCSETKRIEPENNQIDSAENGFEEYYCGGGDEVEKDLQGNDEAFEAAISCSSSEDVLHSENVKDMPFKTNYQNQKMAETNNDAYEAAIFCPSSENVMYSDKLKDTSCEANYQKQKTVEENSKLFETLNENMRSSKTQDKEYPNTSSKDAIKHSIDKSSDKIDDSSKFLENRATPKLSCEQVSKGIQNKVTNNQSDIQFHGKIYSCSHVCKENRSKSNDCMQEGIRQLKEKIYFLMQEQQKMAILQRFLHSKKYLLEETARNLDEKRIELANWELNLYNKAKKLQDAELKYKQWLQPDNEVLYDKAMKLANKEKVLIGQEDVNSSSGSKQEYFKRFADDSRDISLASKNGNYLSYKNKETGDISYSYSGNSTKLEHSSTALSVSECKSVASSLEQIEKNLLMIKKINTAKEVRDDCWDESEHLPPHSTPTKNDVSMESLEKSKGSHHIPEHIKYWLNKRDNSAL